MEAGIMMKIRAILVLIVIWLSLPCIDSAVAANPADIHHDFKVDWLDLKMFCENWLSTDPTPADIDNSSDVNLPDFAILAKNWQWIGLPMVLIQGGEFLMGDSFNDGDASALPVHDVNLDSFYMSSYEITNQQYCDYLNDAYPQQIKVVNGKVFEAQDEGTTRPFFSTSSAPNDFPDYGNYSQIDFNDNSFTFTVITKNYRDMSNDPVVVISWFGAVAFCDYYSYRLPTEAQWEYAARGGNLDPNYRFPWGDTISHTQANYYSQWSGGNPDYPYDLSVTEGHHPDYNDVVPYTAPGGSFSPNSYGLYDMAGNISEWCNDWYDLYEICYPPPCDNPQGPPSTTFPRAHVLRGGDWNHAADSSTVAYRNYNTPDIRTNTFGFRVVRDVE